MTSEIKETEEYKIKLGEKPEEIITSEFMLKFPSLFKTEKIISSVRPKVSYYWESRKYIGISLEDLNQKLSKHFGVDEGEGLMISDVIKNSPADKAGLKVGDVIIRADGERVEKIKSLVEKIQDKDKGDKIEIEVIRDGKKKKFNVEIDEEKKDWSSSFKISWNGDIYIHNLQNTIKNLNRQLKKWEQY